MKIDEDGCEAAAYTILGVEATAMMGPEDEIDFTLDKPFVFAITGIDGLPLLWDWSTSPVDGTGCTPLRKTPYRNF